MQALSSQSLRQNPDFVRLWVGQTVSQLGSQVGAGAITLVAILVLHASAAQIGLLGAASGVASLGSSLLVGTWVDRTRRRPLLIAADLGRFVLLALVTILAVLGGLSFPVLLGIAAMVAALTSVFDVTYPSYLPSLVGRERLLEGNARLTASSSFAEVVGQPVGGGLVLWLGASVTVLIDGFSFLASAVSIMLIRKPESRPITLEASSPEPRPKVFSGVLEGARFVFRHELLRPLAVTAIISHLGGGVIGALYTLYGLRALGLTPFTLGVVIGIGGVLSLVGSAVVERATRAFGFGRALTWAAVAGAAFTLLIPLAGGPFTALVLVVSQLGDVFGTVSMINQTSLQQSLVPDAWLGRVNSSLQFLTRAMLALGAALGGTVAEVFGVRTAMTLGVLLVLLASLWIARSPIRTLRELPQGS
jgi:predicted MFS family arabinose efflux permease